VIERPRQYSCGALGSQTRYPPGTATVLLEALEVHRKQRNLGTVVWAMWWRGLTRPELAARARLTAFARKLIEIERRLVSVEGNLTEEAEAKHDRAGTPRLSKPLRQMRRRVGADRFDEVVQALLYVAAGQAPTLGPETLGQLEHAMGMDGWGPGFEEMLVDADGQAYLVLIWLRCRQFGLGTGMQGDAVCPVVDGPPHSVREVGDAGGEASHLVACGVEVLVSRGLERAEGAVC